MYEKLFYGRKSLDVLQKIGGPMDKKGATQALLLWLLVGLLYEAADAAALDGSCTVDTNCTATVANSVCTGTDGSKTCSCADGYIQHNIVCKAKLGTACTANGDQCDALTGGYCAVGADGGAKCACAAINQAGTDGDTTCTPKVCNGDATVCTGVDPNSRCESNACACTVTYELTGSDNANLCSAKAIESSCDGIDACADINNAVCESSKCVCPTNSFPSEAKNTCLAGIGTTCTASGNECVGITGAICDTSADPALCSCPDTHTANAEGSQCTPKNIAVGPAASVILLLVCYMLTFLRQ